MIKKDPTEKLRIFSGGVIVVLMILVLFFDGKGVTFVTDWFTKIFTSLVYSIFAGAIVGMFTGNLFERYNSKLIGIKFNLPVVALTFIVKIWLF